jgi:serine protease DegS
LALIKVDFKDRETTPITIHPSQRMETGQDVYVIGFPIFHPVNALSATITAGTLTKIVRVHGVPAQLQTDAQVHDGNSGGMLVNSNMELLGIVTSNARHQMDPDWMDSPSVIIPKLNFSIPVSRMKPIVKAIEKDGIKLLNCVHLVHRYEWIVSV